MGVGSRVQGGETMSLTETATLKAPFPYFGGKSKIAVQVWDFLGDTPNYIEPFCGSSAVLLGRPNNHTGGIETINDMDGLLANFWRALAYDPDGVAHYADYPVIELDLHARHSWLIGQKGSITEKLRADPTFYDVQAAGWWVWGISAWIGSGWGAAKKQQIPHLGGAGMGVHRTKQQRPHLGDAGKGVHRASQTDLYGYFQALAHRLRRVRVCSGDWTRVAGESVTIKNGLTSVFLDPPYSAEAKRDDSLYANESLSVAHDVRAWCLENGANPLLRIVLAGYDGEHNELEQHGWRVHVWNAGKGYAGVNADNENGKRERLWVSPHCLDPFEYGLFGGAP